MGFFSDPEGIEEDEFEDFWALAQEDQVGAVERLLLGVGHVCGLGCENGWQCCLDTTFHLRVCLCGRQRRTSTTDWCETRPCLDGLSVTRPSTARPPSCW